MTLVARPTGLSTAAKTAMTTRSNQKPAPPGLAGRAFPDQPAGVPPAASPRAGQPVVVTLPGEIDVVNASQVYDALTRARGSGTAVVVADATETTFCDCAGTGALIRALHRAAAAGTELRLAAATSRQVRRILELTGADQVLDTYPTLTAALHAPPR
jgi:anti-sigma B factor antagonist